MVSETEQHLEILARAAKEGRCVLFLGAGATATSKKPTGEYAPKSGKELASRIARHFFKEEMQDYALTEVCAFVDSQFGRADLANFLYKELIDLDPSEGLRRIPDLPWPAIYTTNIDVLVERSFELHPNRTQNCRKILSTRETLYALTGQELPLYKLHGCITLGTSGETPLILTHDDYARSSDNRGKLFARLMDHRGLFTIIYVGYSLQDGDIARVLSEIERDVTIDCLRRSYSIRPGCPLLEKQALERHKITVLDMTADSFFTEMAERCASFPAVGMKPSDSPVTRGAIALKARLPQIPDFLAEGLSKDFEIVSSSAGGAQAPQEFFKGAPAQWSIFAGKYDASRDLYDTLMDELYDHALGTTKGPRCLVVVGEAGSGKTTFIKRVAFDLAGSDQLVLYLRASGNLDDASIENLCQQSAKRMYLFLDSAADHAGEIAKTMRRALSNHSPLTIVACERANEWHSATQRWDIPRLDEHLLTTLSSKEIERLIEVLGRARCLGALSDLPHDEQTRAIRDRAGKHLLVALREATEGRRFDEIIIDELKGIPQAEAVEAYKLICSVACFGASLRVTVLHRVLNIPYEDFASKVFGPAERVIVECQDPTVGPYHAESYSARHQAIASIVVNQGIPTERERLDYWTKIAYVCDPGITTDRKACRELSRCENVLPLLPSLQMRRELYEALVRSDVRNPFILQQYAMMESQSGQIPKAFELIEKAVALAPQNTILLHTKARVLSCMAKQESDPRMRDRLFEDAEAIFRDCTRRDTKSSYGYQSLARLLVERGEALQEEQRVALIRSAYEVLEMGISKALNRSILYSEIGRIDEKCGKPSEARAAFEKARGANPSDPVCRYLYARMEYRCGEYQKAARLLDEAMRLNPSHPGINLWRARVALRIDPSNVDAILRWYNTAVQERPDDPYTAVEYAIYLYRIERWAEGRTVFKGIDTSGMNARDVYAQRERLSDSSGSPLLLKGTVIRLYPSFGFIAVDVVGQDIYFNIKDCDRVIVRHLEPNDRVVFSVAFNFRGPVAVDIRHNV